MDPVLHQMVHIDNKLVTTGPLWHQYTYTQSVVEDEVFSYASKHDNGSDEEATGKEEDLPTRDEIFTAFRWSKDLPETFPHSLLTTLKALVIILKL